MTAIPALEIAPLGPIVATAVGGMVVLLLEVWLTRRGELLGRETTPALVAAAVVFVAVLALGAAFAMACVAFSSGDTLVFQTDRAFFQLDAHSAFATALLAATALLCCVLALGYLAELRINHGEYFALVLFATSGAMLLVGAVDSLVVYLGVELMALPLYVLVGFDRRRVQSNESALKYFLTGVTASAVMLYGLALLYGATGSTSYAVLRTDLDFADPLAAGGLALVLAGFGFKISAVPFHQWTPDVVEGAPSSAGAFLSVAVKVAGFVALMRWLGLGLGPEIDVSGALRAAAVATLVVGSVMAVIQESVKRLLGWVGVVHAGLLLAGLATGGANAYGAALFHLVAYGLTSLGAFSVVVVLAHRGRDCERLSSFSGLARTRPGLAALMALFAISLAGLPGTAGFAGRIGILLAAAEAGEIALLITVAVTSVAGVYACLRIPLLMYMSEPREEPPRLDLSSGEGLVLAACGVGVVFFGFLPNGRDLPLLDWARASVHVFFPS